MLSEHRFNKSTIMRHKKRNTRKLLYTENHTKVLATLFKHVGVQRGLLHASYVDMMWKMKNCRQREKINCWMFMSLHIML